MNQGMKDVHTQYQRIMKSLGSKVDSAENRMLKKLVALDYDQYDSRYKKAVEEIIASYKNDITKVLEDSSNYALQFAKDYKIAQYTGFIEQVKKLAKKYNVSPKLFELDSMIPIFGGGMDKEILEAVWNKKYPDGLVVEDRINRLGNLTKQKVEQILKSGISEGKSAVNIAKDLRQTLQVEGLERKAAIRLAAHTTNQVYQTAQAEISMQATFVMGIRIVRGMYGNISENCSICEEHGGTDYKEYYKDDFGGRSADLWIMTNAPAYHVNCSCGVEDIIESAEDFIAKAREEYKR